MNNGQGGLGTRGARKARTPGIAMMTFDDTFETLFAIQRALDSRRASNWMGSSTTGVGSFPPINVFQRGDDLVAIVELPGVDTNNLEIEAKENTIRISGRKAIRYNEGASVHRRERSGGSFDRTIQLPIQIDPDAVTAEFQEGVLALFIPRAESDKPRTIKIK
jgi:HSP20 family protein